MERQIFSDGIGLVTIIGGTVRLDFVTFSATEKDAKGQPAAVFCQRVVLGMDGFLRAAEKIQEAAQAVSKLTQLPPPPRNAQPESAPVPVPNPGPDAPIAIEPGSPVRRPFP